MTAENTESPKPKTKRVTRRDGNVTVTMDIDYFRRVGAEGGKARAKKHGKRKLSRWGKLGGRPPIKVKTKAPSKAKAPESTEPTETAA
jgi:hypothetical protein